MSRRTLKSARAARRLAEMLEARDSGIEDYFMANRKTAKKKRLKERKTKL